MRNHVLYLTPLIALEISDKEGAVVDTIFCPPSICMPDPENSKNIIFSPWGPFRHQSTRSAILGQIDQIAPSQP